MKLLLYIIFFTVFILSSVAVYGQNSSFTITLDNEVNEQVTEFVGDDVFFTQTPSALSILFSSDEIRCGHHFTSLKERLQAGSYKTQYNESPRFGAVCLLINSDDPERLASESGTITIDGFTRNNLTGTFDIVFTGSKSGKEYKISGEFNALSAD